MLKNQLSFNLLQSNILKYRPEFYSIFIIAHDRLEHYNYIFNDSNDIEIAIELHTDLYKSLLNKSNYNIVSIEYKSRQLIEYYIKLRYLCLLNEKEKQYLVQINKLNKNDIILSSKIVKLHQNNQLNESNIIIELGTALNISTTDIIWSEIVFIVSKSLPFADLTGFLLSSGADDRSILNEYNINKYYTSTFPSNNIIPRASSTCSYINMNGYEAAERIRIELLLFSLDINTNNNINEIIKNKTMDLKNRIIQSLNITKEIINDSLADLILTPSGSDAEMIATLAAIARFTTLNNNNKDNKEFKEFKQFKDKDLDTKHGIITSIMVLDGEIGSYSAMASKMKHFSHITPSKKIVKTDEHIFDYYNNIELIKLQARDNIEGKFINQDDKIRSLVLERLNNNNNNIVLLHAVVGSKTGLSCPSKDLIDELTLKYKNNLLIVIDACQMRINETSFNYFMQNNYIIMITGSKYFTGAPFSGGVILPFILLNEIENLFTFENSSQKLIELFKNNLCKGLSDYFQSYFFPNTMKNTIHSIEEYNIKNKNNNNNLYNDIGLILRWETGLIYMEKLSNISFGLKTFIHNEYITLLKILILSLNSNLNTFEILKLSETKNENTFFHPNDTIVSFSISEYNNKNIKLSFSKLKTLHSLLTKDVSNININELSNKDKVILSNKCILGQPVQMDNLNNGIIRISIGADMLVDVITTNDKKIINDVIEDNQMKIIQNNIQNLIEKDTLIFSKIQILLKYWPIFTDINNNNKIITYQNNKDFHVINRVPKVLKKLINDKILSDNDTNSEFSQKLLVLYDLDYIDWTIRNLLTSFPSHFQHHFAVKSCPLTFFLKKLIHYNIGFECASIIEVEHVLLLLNNENSNKIIFDSPCKTYKEILFGLKNKININIDNFDELLMIKDILNKDETLLNYYNTSNLDNKHSIIGLRINPLVGSGKNNLLSVSTLTSKFGILLNDINKKKIIHFCMNNMWLKGLHCHVGSQGDDLKLLVKGMKILHGLANEIDMCLNKNQIQVLNIGGGLSVNYKDDTIVPSFSDYANEIKKEDIELFNNKYNRRIFTEFGRSISAKVSWTVSEVEYVKEHTFDNNNNENSTSQAVSTAIIHAGSDLFLRTCYKPELFSHRLSVFNSKGNPSEAGKKVQNIAGPLCFGGDLIGNNILLQKIEKGDFLVIHDTGSNTYSLFSRHCSRAAPAVFGYSILNTNSNNEEIIIKELKPAEKSSDVIKFWGN